MARLTEPAKADSSPVVGRLTPRERDVAALLARGYTNRRIAEELVIANSTAERHVANILAKLNAHTRAEAAVRVADAGLNGTFGDDAWSWPARARVRTDNDFDTGNLPAELNSFVGRNQEMRELAVLLSTTRLLTLTGPGGVGKTRLALRLAAIVAPRYPDGCWLVRLDELADPELVAANVAAAMNIREVPRSSPVESLLNAIGGRHLLIVLDNCEHLVQACAGLTAALLSACRDIQILATSREPLRAAGETTWRVSGLSVPRMLEHGVVNEAATSDSGRLFLERARAAVPGFVLSEQTARAVADICRRLDGIPLALELAAVRVRMLDVPEIAARLEDHLRLLVGGSRTGPPRQQTLRATLDWSYELLSEPERQVFQRLAVFVGEWTLEAAEATCGRGEIAAGDVLNLLGQLVDKSLVVASGNTEGEVRYRLLETIRQFARERLEATGDAEAICRSHAKYYLAMAERAQPNLTGPEQEVWLHRLEQEHENIRGALGWALDVRESDLGLRLANAVWMFWSIRGHLSEGRRWYEQLLGLSASTDTASLATRANALTGAGVLAIEQGDYTSATDLLRQTLALSRKIDDKRGSAWCLFNLGRIANEQCNYSSAADNLEASIALYREVGDTVGIAPAKVLLGMVAAVQGDYGKAAELAEEGLALGQRCEDSFAVAASLLLMGLVARDVGDQPRAAALVETSLGLFRALGDKLLTAYALSIRGLIARDQGDYAKAAAGLEEALMLLRGLGSRSYTARSLSILGSTVLAQGDPSRAIELLEQARALALSSADKCGEAMALEELAAASSAQAHPRRAARQLASARALRQAIGAPLPPADRSRFERISASIRARLGDHALGTV